MPRSSAYRERLTPGWWVFVLIAAFIAMVAIAYGAVLGARTGWLLFLAGTVVAFAVTIATSPVLTVSEDAVRVGRARLPRASISSVEVRDRDGARRALLEDARLFTVLRTSRSPRAVLLRLQDPADPHPGWLISTRRPEAVRTALG